MLVASTLVALLLPLEVWAERYLQVRGDLGVGSAIGAIGVSAAYQPIDWIEIEAGLGVGLSGFQTSLMPKLALGGQHHRFITGVGASVGWGHRSTFPRDYDRPVLWLNVDAVGYEYTSDAGFVFFAAMGGTRALDGSALCVQDQHSDCRPNERIDLTKETWPQGRIGFGAWF